MKTQQSLMTFHYFYDEEHYQFFPEFSGVRRQIARRLTEYCSMSGLILDASAGHGYLGLADAQRSGDRIEKDDMAYCSTFRLLLLSR